MKRKGAISRRAGEISRMRAVITFGLALVVMAAVACADAETLDCPDGAEQFVKYELFMGRNNDSGEVVDDDAWEAFLADTATPRFPDGLTVLDGRGQWRDSAGVITQERSKVLVILAPPGNDSMHLIDEISQEYMRRFGQESVLKVVGDACVSFS